jgi:carotenoid cleavage dioxygenase-like enzyme
MKRRDFLQIGGMGAVGVAAATALPGCSQEDKSEVKFWQQGNYRPVEEEITVTDLKVEGSIPPELSGLYVRNGTNQSSGNSEHFFGGDGMLHGVKLDNGKASWYRNRYVDTPVYRKEKGMFSAPTPEDTTSAVSLIYHGDKLLSLGEFGLPYEIDPSDLSTRGAFNYDGKLAGNMTAHPRIDPQTGEMIFFGYNVMAPYLTYYRADAAGNLIQKEDIVTTGPSMIHDFAVTENYVVFMEMPVRFSWWLLAFGDGLPFRWDNSAVCRFGVMPRTGGNSQVKWFDVPPCFIFHVMNSFEQGDEVIMDAARYDKLWVTDSSDFFHPAYLTRFTMNMKTGQASEQRMHDQPMEFPQVDRRLWTSDYRYGYSLITDEGTTHGEMVSEAAAGFRKYDVKTGEVENHELSKQYAPNEAFFIPATETAGEDEGYLVSFVYDKNSETSALWIMDATNIQAQPIAKVQLPSRVPQGFHGLWLPDSALA